MKLFRLPLFAALVAAWILSVPAVADVPAASRPGKFAWVDLVTTDLDAAVNFYTKTFGWTAQKVAGTKEPYTLLFNDGQPVAGVAYRPADAGSKAAGARWIGSIAVTDINRAVSSVTAAGGKVLFAPRQIPGRGWQALVADPEGSIFGLIVPEKGKAEAAEPALNSWIWVQLLSGKPATMVKFYEQALGYEISEDKRTPRPDDYLLSSGGFVCAGLTPLATGTGARPGWLGYLQVADTDATLAAAKALGARVLVAPEADPKALRIAIIVDPLGGAIGLVSASTQAEDTK